MRPPSISRGQPSPLTDDDRPLPAHDLHALVPRQRIDQRARILRVEDTRELLGENWLRVYEKVWGA